MRFIALLAVICTSHFAWAQHGHHHAAADEMPDHGHSRAPAIKLMVGLSAEMGRVEAFASEVDYQGVALMVDGSRGDLEVGAHLPFYRIDLGGRNGTGVGDIHLEGRWMGLRSDAIHAGLALGIMPPFGDDDDGLGMGHWMVMTGAVVRWGRGRLSLNGRFGYNGALDGGGHAEHGVPVWPPVSPMNAHELALSGGASIAVTSDVGLSLQLSSAAPLGSGEFIALAGGGASYNLGRVQLGVGVRHGLSGHTAGLVASGHAMASF